MKAEAYLALRLDHQRPLVRRHGYEPRTSGQKDVIA